MEGAAAEIPGFGGAPGGPAAEDREGSAERLPGGEALVVVLSWWKKGVASGHGKSPGGDMGKSRNGRGYPTKIAV